MKIYWWDEQNYGSWAFVLAHSEEEAWEKLEESAKQLDAKDPNNIMSDGTRWNWHQHAVETFKRLNSLQTIECGAVEWGEWA
jgi:hypothetical protein